MKFTYEYSKSEINFLDLRIKFEKGSLVTSAYIKLRDVKQYLSYCSSIRIIIYSQ